MTENNIYQELSEARSSYFTAADSRQMATALEAIERIDIIAIEASDVLSAAIKAIDDIAVSISSRECNQVFPEIIKRIQEKHKKEGNPRDQQH